MSSNPVRRASPLRVLTGTALLAVLGTNPAVTQSGVPDAIHVGIPPNELHMRFSSSTLVPSNQLRAEIRLSTQEKWVEIRWRYSASGGFPLGVDAHATQHVALAYWPTAAEVVATNKILVAGKEPRGATRIEVWTLALPTVGTAGGAYVLSPNPVADVTSVYQDAVEGKDMVRFMLKLRGKPASALVQYHDSKDVYELSWGSSPYDQTLVLAKATVPALDGKHNRFHAGEHQTHGYVYVLSDLDNYGQEPPLVLFDSNKDGALDANVVMSWDTYTSQGLNDLNQYVEHGGIPVN